MGLSVFLSSNSSKQSLMTNSEALVKSKGAESLQQFLHMGGIPHGTNLKKRRSNTRPPRKLSTRLDQILRLLLISSVPKRPIRFKLSVRTRNPLLWVSWNLPTNEATGHHPTVECKQTMVSQNACIADSTLWSSCSGGNKFDVVASNLLRTCFKSQSLPNSIIFITERHLHMFLTLCSQLRFTKLRRRSV